MQIVQQLQEKISELLVDAYAASIDGQAQALQPSSIVINATRSDMRGDFTVVTFGLTKLLRQSPEQIGQFLAEKLTESMPELAHVEVLKGFVNIELSDAYWKQQLSKVLGQKDWARLPGKGQRTMVEFASPNTNKPLHLGHIRNILLGWSISKILDAAGHEVIRVQIINDRGIAICKSMLAWQRFADGATPESNGMKGDHFVGHWYLEFEKHFKEEYSTWQDTATGKEILAKVPVKEDETPAKVFKNRYFNEYSELGKAARDMLLAWENGDPEVRAIWAQMNGWVYEGFDKTYERLGVNFDRLYYESETYLLGKQLVEEGLSKGLFEQDPDGSIWIDLSAEGLDRKILLRADGTSVYVTQDLGTAHQRYEDFGIDAMIYTVADEQNYHFEVLFKTLKHLGEPYADRLYHLSYGMMELPSGRMKTREGTVVDADDLMDEVVAEARSNAEERAEMTGNDTAAREASAEQVGLAAIKYYILKVNPKRRMIFNPSESVDLQGATGPYIQYSYVRANGVALKAAQLAEIDEQQADQYLTLHEAERELISHMVTLPEVIDLAARELDPSAVAAYAYNLAKSYHRFWHDLSVLSAESDAARAFRVGLSRATASALRTSMDLLGIELPERM